MQSECHIQSGEVYGLVVLKQIQKIMSAVEYP